MATTKVKIEHNDILSKECLNNTPNKLTSETIEKALKGIDVEAVDGVGGLFKNLDD